MQIDSKQLQALAIVIEEQSFEKAAVKLHLTQSAISQRIKQLEDKLGQILLLRNQPLQATENGQKLLRYYYQTQLLHTELLQDLKPEHKQDKIRLAIGVNADSLETWFLPCIAPLVEQYELLLDIKVDDQQQTHKLLTKGEVLGCITSTPKAPQGCHCIALGKVTYRCIATQEYCNKYFKSGVNKEGFKQAPIAEFNHKDQLQNQYLKQYFDINPGEYSCHRIPASYAFLAIICQGQACGMVPEHQAKPLLEQGQVIELTPGQQLDIDLYWHVWDLGSHLLKQLTHLLTDTEKTGLSQ